jgi:Asp-tRNA(Asn)/Glu-tRNA(Gln) amidotransferase A subunit family amidase
MQIIAGYDAQDSTSANKAVPDYLEEMKSARPLRIGVPRKFFFDELDAEVAAAVEQALEVLGDLFGEIHEVNLEVPTDRSLQAAESYAFHAERVSRNPELFQPETLRRIKSGEAIGADQLEQARKKMEEQRRQIASVFDDVDVLVTPATPIPAPNLDKLKQNFDLLRPRELLLLRNTRPFNVWGLPAISVPSGFTAEGLPIGLQIAGRHWGEVTVLRVAHAYEQATTWHLSHPKLA